MKTIGITANLKNPRAEDMLSRLGACVALHGLALLAWDETGEVLDRLTIPCLRGRPQDADVILVLGGDGTMLRAIRDTVEAHKPFIGVNIGGLGFLTSVAPTDLERAVVCLARNDFITSSRSLATCTVMRKGALLGEFMCLNDLVIRNGGSGRMLSLEIAVDKGASAPISGDGLIIATPTGSTGHSLSAGGPILHPASPAFVVTFICAHALSARPLVIPDTSSIEVALVRCAEPVTLIVDGQAGMTLRPGDCVRASRAANGVLFIHLPGYDFLSLLQAKLHWQGSSL